VSVEDSLGHGLVNFSHATDYVAKHSVLDCHRCDQRMHRPLPGFQPIRVARIKRKMRRPILQDDAGAVSHNPGPEALHVGVDDRKDGTNR